MSATEGMQHAFRTVLHVGCGADPLPAWLHGAEETRVDIDAGHSPHIVADMRQLGDVGKFDAVLCQHALEHIAPHEVVPTLAGFRRLLNDGGAVLIVVPDLEDVRATDDLLFESPAGPITGLDLIYGHRASLPDHPWMAHHCGFTEATLTSAMRSAGFAETRTSRLPYFNLFAVGKS